MIKPIEAVFTERKQQSDGPNIHIFQSYIHASGVYKAEPPGV